MATWSLPASGSSYDPLNTGNFDFTYDGYYVIREPFTGYPSTWGNPIGVQINASGASNIGVDVTSATDAAEGIIGMGTGTTTSHYSLARSYSLFWPTKYEVKAAARLSLGTAVPDGTNDYLAMFGLWSVNVLDSTPNDGSFFAIDRTIDDTYLICSSVKGGTRTNTSTTIAFSDILHSNEDWVNIGVYMSGTDSASYFYVNGSLVATHDSTYFATADDVRFHIYNSNVAGSTTRYVLYDDWSLAFKRNDGKGSLFA